MSATDPPHLRRLWVGPEERDEGSAIIEFVFLAVLMLVPIVYLIVALGRIAHDTVLKTLSRRGAAFPFKHGALHDLGHGAPKLFDSYHCSRYNTNTGVLTRTMFGEVFRAVRDCLAVVEH